MTCAGMVSLTPSTPPCAQSTELLLLQPNNSTSNYPLPRPSNPLHMLARSFTLWCVSSMWHIALISNRLTGTELCPSLSLSLDACLGCRWSLGTVCVCLFVYMCVRWCVWLMTDMFHGPHHCDWVPQQHTVQNLSSSVLPHFMCHHCSGCTGPVWSEFRWSGAVATDTQSDTCHVPALHCWPHRWSTLTVCWGHTSSVHCTS